MATAKRTGRPWRRVRLLVLQRDGYVCRMRGPRCTGVATTVDHIVPLHLGGSLLDPANLRAACAKCNYGGGARITNATRRAAAVRVARTQSRLWW